MADAMDAYLVGRGRLTWDRCERVSDRYGFVYLLNSGDSMSPAADYAEMVVRPEHVGKKCRLIAEVTETRESTHIGDIFRGVYPTTPNVGERIVLGEGELTAQNDESGQLNVGVRPEDGRTDLLLDINALYRCHEQTVNLIYELL